MSRLINIMRTSDRLMIRFLATGLIAGLACPFSFGQVKTEIQKLWQDDKIGYIIDNQKDKLLSNADFYNYARIRDEEFAEYLKETWSDYSISAGLSEEPRSSLIKQPVFDYSSLDITPPVNLPFSAVPGFNGNGKGQLNPVPRIRKPESDEFTSVKGIFPFYGQQISIQYDKLLTLSATASVSEDSVSGFWKSFSRSNSNHLVDQLMYYRDLLGLGDWGYFQLVKAASNHIFTDNRWRADQLTWALMIRSGFDVRLAFNQNSTTVLFPSENTIYSRQFVMIGQKRFYLDREMNSQLLVTCQNPFPDTGGMIDLKFYRSLNFNGKLAIRKFLVKWNNKNHEFALRYNPETIRFYNDYPSTDPSVYFGAPVSSILKEDLLEQFYPLLSKLNKAQATVLLQQFVQREFEYSSLNKKDELTHSRFAEEIIASRSGDDRSKAVLFSRLIRILLQLPVVGVQFPDYFSTAVCFDEPFDGDFYYWKQGKYIITDPTFLNAPIGVMMPEFSGITPQLIDLSSADSQSDNAQEIWKLAFKRGARRGGASQDVVFDRQGRAFITGYFTDKKSNNPFIACFSEGNSLQWIRKFEGDGKAAAFAITKVNDDEIFIAGSFSGKMEMEGKTLLNSNKNGDLFIAQFNQNGELIWMKNVGIDSTAQDRSLTYSVKFDRSGDNISVQFLNEDGRNIKNDFGGVSETEIYFTVSGNFVSSGVPLSRTVAKSDISGEMAKEYNLLRRHKCHPKVIDAIAVMKLLQKSGMEITGNQIQRLMTRNNPSFAVDHATLFNSLGQIGLLKNDNGIVSLRTIDNKPIILNYLRMEDGARFNISVFGNGDLSVGIISGFQNVVNTVALSLNSLLIDCSSGNVILDYDHDHTLKTVSPETLFSAK